MASLTIGLAHSRRSPRLRCVLGHVRRRASASTRVGHILHADDEGGGEAIVASARSPVDMAQKPFFK